MRFEHATKIHWNTRSRCRRCSSSSDTSGRSSRRLRHLWALLLASYRAPLTLSEDGFGAVPVSPDRRQQHQQRVLLRGSPLASKDDPATSTPPAPPEQLHLAFADPRGARDVYAVSVSWLTWVDAKSHVFWGRDVDALREVAAGNATRESIPVAVYPVVQGVGQQQPPGFR